MWSLHVSRTRQAAVRPESGADRSTGGQATLEVRRREPVDPRRDPPGALYASQHLKEVLAPVPTQLAGISGLRQPGRQVGRCPR